MLRDAPTNTKDSRATEPNAEQERQKQLTKGNPNKITTENAEGEDQEPLTKGNPNKKTKTPINIESTKTTLNNQGENQEPLTKGNPTRRQRHQSTSRDRPKRYTSAAAPTP
jgi:hypothetical protein